MKFPRTALRLALAGLALSLGTAAAMAASAMSTTTLNVRSGPGPHYGVVDVLRAGEWVDVDRCVGSWCLVTHRGPDGWVSARYLSRGGYDRPPVYVRPPYPPQYYPYHPYYPHYPYHSYGSFCVNGKNAQFCIGGY